jgi:hypothetical protein
MPLLRPNETVNSDNYARKATAALLPSSQSLVRRIELQK